MPTSSLSSISAADPLREKAEGKPSLALQDKLAKCEKQLGDWQACPSSKTPEGKQIIQNLQTQIRSLESKIASAENPNSTDQPNTASAQKKTYFLNSSRSAFLSTLGNTVDVFA
jgi:hypothetical protein